MDKFVGESEKRLRALFKYCAQFRCILFFDEIDALLTKRGADDSEAARRLKTEFLQLTDGVQANTAGFLLVAATNTPQDLDDAARRRFDERIYLPLPGLAEREAVIRQNLEKDANKLSDREIAALARATERFSFSDLRQLAQKAARNVLRGKDLSKLSAAPPVRLKDYEQALREVRPSNSEAQVRELERWARAQ